MAAPLRSRSPRTAPADSRPSRRKPLPRTALPGVARITSLHDPLPPIDLTDPAPRTGEVAVVTEARPEQPVARAPRPTAAPAAGTTITAPPPAPTAEVEVAAPVAPEAASAPVAAPASIDLTESDPDAQLAATLADLRDVFAMHPHRSAMPACRHCVSEADRAALARAPHEVPDEVLARFATKALITWGEVPDLKRLLPEILTRTVAGGELAVPPGLIGSRLRKADWRSWPAAEAPAVRRTLRAAWIAALAAEPAPGSEPITRPLALVAAAETDLSPYLDLWEDRLESPGNPAARLTAVLHLADLLAPLATGGRRHLSRTLPLARRSVVGQLDHWLRQPSVVHRLLQAADALEGTEHAERIREARRGLARLRTDG